MSQRTQRPQSAIAAAIEAGEWDRLTLALALALARLLETLPPDMAPELLTLLAGDDETAHGEPFDSALAKASRLRRQGDRHAR